MRASRWAARFSKPWVWAAMSRGRARCPVRRPRPRAACGSRPGTAQVTVDPDLKELVAEGGASTDQAAGVLWVLEPTKAGFRQRVTLTMLAPACFASPASRASGDDLSPVRPTTRIRSAFPGHRGDAALATPITSASAKPEDSWHMFEQSAGCRVPYARTNNWDMNAASLMSGLRCRNGPGPASRGRSAHPRSCRTPKPS